MALKSKLVKLRKKVYNVGFFNSLFIKRARALIFDLHEGTIYSFVKFQLESLSSNIERAFEEEKNLIKGSVVHQL